MIGRREFDFGAKTFLARGVRSPGSSTVRTFELPD
jgi:hypothetical protein